ncbi:AMP-binding protein [Pseudomonas syringae]|uniref:AMP-binding protein n=1 Tax=Pseudomonas syringae TaxID=317 RepID=UPI0013734574|nr:AMP-binding protein [Pseudomonas syringae]NAT24348.1 acyl-CoA synthetase [Pseudomonas syringae pv. actinidifoliorum]
MFDSLPQALLQQAQTRGDQTALRYKQLGIWQRRSWSELALEVSQLAAALKGRGFDSTHPLVILSEARAEALLLTLAAHWLGGTVSLLDPAADNREWLANRSLAFAVAYGPEALHQLRSASPGVVVLLDKRGLGETQDINVIDYARLLSDYAADAADPVQSPAAAFLFPSVDQPLGVQLSHTDLLAGARQLVDRHGLSARDQALAARVFAAGGQARYLLTPWLVAGFCLNFPEALSTRDNDRRELGPTLVLGTRESYARLELWAMERLPLPGSISHRLYQWAMAPAPGALRRWLGYWLIRRPLLDVLGMSRLSTPLLVGDALTASSQAFFAALGIRPVAPDQDSPTQPSPAFTPPVAALMSVPS